MTKTIDTLVEDIYNLFEKDHTFSEESIKEFGVKLGERIAERVSETQKPGTLRLSNLGWPDRKLWFSVRHPEKAEALPPYARIKFLYGDILEELLLFLSREAGHEVEDEQKEVSLHGVKGHIDGKIDGSLVDCKSASTYSFKKFQEGLTPETDSFGYLVQLGAYDEAEGLPTNPAFLAIDKTLGHLTLDVQKKREVDWENYVNHKKDVVSREEAPPRCYSAEPDGKSGNMKLGVNCSYCPFKKHCWPTMRTFLYSTGPRYLVHIERTPDVPEVRE